MSDIRIRGDFTLPIQVSITFITENRRARKEKEVLKSNDSNISIYSPLLHVLNQKNSKLQPPLIKRWYFRRIKNTVDSDFYT